MSSTNVAIIGAGPYGLSLAAHLAARKVEHRIFGRPMHFWSQVADAGKERYLKTYCFGTNLSTPADGFSFADYNTPRGLETFEPCSMANFTDYGQWFQQNQVPWTEPVDVTRVERQADGFAITLSSGERMIASRVVVATGLAYFAKAPSVVSSLPPELMTHTSKISSFEAFKGRTVAIIGAGQSALEAAALLREAGAEPRLIVRENAVRWHSRIPQHGRSLYQRVRSPISGLGFGPKAWVLTNLPGALHLLPERLRTPFVLNHLPPEGAWWLRPRVENLVPVDLNSTVIEARESGQRVSLRVLDSSNNTERQIEVDHVIAGSGYDINVNRLDYLDPTLRSEVACIERSPNLNARFESTAPGLHFIGPISAISFGPLFRFVGGCGYTAQTLSAHLSAQPAHARYSLKVSPAV
jgi:FAD-dependent urate hydroxylase